MREWTLLGMPEPVNLPAMKWRPQNLNSLSAQKREALVKRLRKALGE